MTSNEDKQDKIVLWVGQYANNGMSSAVYPLLAVQTALD